MRIPLRWSIAAVAVVATSLGVVSFVVVRSVDDKGPAVEAEQPNPYDVAPPGPEVTPVPGSTPDVTKPWWYVPYENEDFQKPRYEQTINGITVGPETPEPRGPCTGASSVQDIPFEKTVGSPVEVNPAHLPKGATLILIEAVECDGIIAAAGLEYEFPADPSIRRFGGTVLIGRRVGDPAAAMGMAAERWVATTVAGHPAIMAGTIVPFGFGDSAILVYADGVLTRIQALGLENEELLRVAEGLFR